MPTLAFACACGCGVFDVGTGTMLPTAEGGEVWLEYNFMNQTQNWDGTSAASRNGNADKVIRTDFFTAGTQYMFSRQWGIEAEIPYWNRTFKTTNDAGDVQTFNHDAIGDIRVKAIYTGLSDDMSTGITFGLKLASGDFTYPNFDRDTSIGTGSTDLLLGAYHQGELTPDGSFNWFVEGQWDQPFAVQQNYRPGDELDTAIGSYYNDLVLNIPGKLSPLLQLIGSVREHDVGLNSSGEINGIYQSGYQRILISPGLEYDVDRLKLYGDVEVPIFQNVNGNQLTAPVLLKFIVGYSF
jgi:hypothetical protein